MENKAVFTIDLMKLFKYILKRIWLVILCAVIGFSAMFYYVAYMQTDRYSAYGTLYVNNSNPNLANYQYVSSNDLSTALQLLDTYMVVVKSNKVMDSVAERLSADYPGIQDDQIRATLSMGSVSDTGVMRVTSTTTDPKLAADICNAVLDVAPAEIIRVVGAGTVEVIDYAVEPTAPVSRTPVKKGIIGGLAGAVVACAILLLFFLLNRRVSDSKELQRSYTPPVMACIKRTRGESENSSAYLLSDNSPREILEGYAKLRMNLMYSLTNHESKVVAVTSAVSGEGKSTISANLALSCAMSMEDVLLIDADLRRGCQSQTFSYDMDSPGLAEVLAKKKNWLDCLIPTRLDTLHILPAGHLPDNPAELLSSMQMKYLLDELKSRFKLILIDVPPVNIVSDPLVLSDLVAGCVFVVRQNFSDHREIHRALISAEMTHMNVFGFVFYGEKSESARYYSKRYYDKYYHYSGSSGRHSGQDGQSSAENHMSHHENSERKQS